MLRVTGRHADGWLPSLGEHLSPEDARRAQESIDEAAQAAGRRPEDVIRAVNVTTTASDPHQIVDQLVQIAEDLGFEKLIVGVPREDPVGFIHRLGENVAPAVRAHFA